MLTLIKKMWKWYCDLPTWKKIVYGILLIIPIGLPILGISMLYDKMGNPINLIPKKGDKKEDPLQVRANPSETDIFEEKISKNIDKKFDEIEKDMGDN